MAQPFLIAVGLLVILVIGMVALSRVLLRRRAANARGRLRRRWARPLAEPHEIRLARRLYDVRDRAGESDRHEVDARTWADLDMNEVFAAVDRTLSPIGAQCLYDALRRPELSLPRLVERDRLASVLADSREVREQLQLQLVRLESSPVWRLPGLLRDGAELPPPPLPLALFHGLSWALPITAILALSFPVLWIPAFLLFCANTILDVQMQRTIALHSSDISYLGRMLGAADRIAGLDVSGLETVQQELRRNLEGTAAIRRRSFTIGVYDPFGLSEYLRSILLRNTIAFFSLRGLLLRYKSQLRKIYMAIGSLDLASSISWYRAEHPASCRPVLSQSASVMQAVDIRHPVLCDAVGNDLAIERGRGLLITGSNMSGKTTFVKTIGVNAILAQSLSTVLADRYEAPFLVTMSSIDILDSLKNGRSYYMDEIESVLRLVRVADEQVTALLLVDEMFRGTNPTERVNAASEVLRYLAKRQMVLAATHDLEVCERLATCFENVHFREHATGEGLDFDFKLRKGPSTTRSAIELLRRAGFPNEIVEAAAAAASSQEPDEALPSPPARVESHS